MDTRSFDAVVVGAGPNGLAAAITLQLAGMSVLLVESDSQIGGGMRTAELTLPGFRHDVCSSVHALADSPLFKSLPLTQFGLKFISPRYAAAHPFDDGTAAVVSNTLEDTASRLREDGRIYKRAIGSVVKSWPDLSHDVLDPLHFPSSPIAFAQFGMKALLPASLFARKFRRPQTQALWAGMAAHSIQPLSGIGTSATALVMLASAHVNGWPFVRGGSASIGSALTTIFTSAGGVVKTGYHIQNLEQIPPCKAILFDLTPRQIIEIAGQKFSRAYSSQLRRYRYGPGVFKVDWALSAPIPFTAADARKSGTVHLGNTIDEIIAYEKDVHLGKITGAPFVLLTQPSLFDESRAPNGKHTAWAYCHVPNGSVQDMTEQIENQVERFAPGFRNLVLARHTLNTSQLQTYNNNYVGGDINGGAFNFMQMFFRPTFSFTPYRTSAKGIYICSSSTPPGGGVHGMCGYHAACTALKDIFRIQPKPLR
jgi:phytoene dehydrogenase-like protein